MSNNRGNNVIDNHSDAVNSQQDVALTVQHHEVMYSGPLPPPSVLEAYGRIDPSYPERIMKQFEENAVHVREMQSKMQDADIKRDKRGQYLAFWLMVIFLTVVTIAMYLGNVVLAGFGGIAFVGTVALMILKKGDKQNLREEPENR